MRAAITIQELSMTAADRLARAIGLHQPLSGSDCEDIIDAGLGGEEDFEMVGPPWIAADGTPAYRYCGTQWTVEYRHGRPHLIQSINVPSDTPGPAVAAAEQAFAFTVHLLEGMRKRPMGEGRVAALREDGWEDAFRHASERDSRAAREGDQAVADADDQEHDIHREEDTE